MMPQRLQTRPLIGLATFKRSQSYHGREAALLYNPETTTTR